MSTATGKSRHSSPHGKSGYANGVCRFLAVSVSLAVAMMAEATEVFMLPTSNIMWRTAPSPEFEVPVLMPYGASSATLVVTGHNYRREYTGIGDGQFCISLPAAESAIDENVYDLALTFNDPAATTRHAKLAVVQGASMEGTAEAAVGSEDAPNWRRVRSRAVLPIPYGARMLSVNGQSVPLDPADTPGWRMFTAVAGTSYDVQLADNASLMWEAMLIGFPSGFKFIFR